MSLYPSGDIASVKDLAVAVSPGIHSLISAKYEKVRHSVTFTPSYLPNVK